MNATTVQRNTIRSFNVLKKDLDRVAAWVAWNRDEHEILVRRIEALESRLRQSEVKYIASAKSHKVHKMTTSHAKRIRKSNKLYFNALADAKGMGYSVCECAA